MATYQIRAMSIGEILDGTFTIYRRHFGTLVGIAIACTGAPYALNLYITPQLQIGAASSGTFVLLLVMVVLFGLGTLIATGATIRVVSEAYLGSDPEIGSALQFAAGKAGRIFIAALAKVAVLGAIWITMGIVAALAVAVAGAAAGLLIAIVVVIVGFVFSIYVAAGYAVVTQSVVLEDLSGATAALPRSWQLTKGVRWKPIVLGIVVGTLIYVPIAVGMSIAALFGGLAFLVDMLAAVLQVLIYPLFPCAFTLFYYDLRVRREAFDLEHLSRQIGLGAGPGRA